MIDYTRTMYRVDDADIRLAADFVERTNLNGLFAQWHRDDDTPRRAARRGPDFTITAVLTCLNLIISLGGTVTIAEILRLLYQLTPAQCVIVGVRIDDADRVRFRNDHRFAEREDARFRAWMTMYLSVLDAHWDMPAKILENHDYQRRLSSRSPSDHARARDRRERGHIAVNALIQASLDLGALALWRGDILADETLIDVASIRTGMGAKPFKRRSAVSRADFYLRTQRHELLTRDGGVTSTQDIAKMGFAVGVTALQAVGPIRAPGSVPRPIVAADIGKPSAGDGDALIRCLDTLHAWQHTPVPSSRAKNRSLAVDMGYIGKLGLSDYLLRHRIDLIHAYPQRRSRRGAAQSSTYVLPANWPTENVRSSGDTRPGPILAWGEWYCPAAHKILAENPTRRRREIGDSEAATDRHDRMLVERMPYVMGRLDRPRLSDTKRAARRRDETAELRWKLRLQCPAEQNRIRCPLKPVSMALDPAVVTATPDWIASEFQCCRSEVTVTLTDRQVTSFQPGFTPGTFEHQTILETYRARTESRFAHLKHPSITGLKRLAVGPRRDPLLLLHIGMAIAISNERIQKNFVPDHTDLVARDLRAIDRKLGRRVTRQPYRS